MNTTASRHPHCDALLCITVAALILTGLVMVYSASAVYAMEEYNDSFHFLKRQFVWLVLGLATLWAAKQFDYRKWEDYTYPIMGITLLLLCLIMVPGLGREMGGARRWISIAGFSFQPSELAKFTLILFIAKSVVKRADKLKNFAYGYLPNLIVLAVFFVLILFQPDFGTAMIICTVTLAMLFIAGVRKRYLFFSVLAVLPFLVSAVVSAEYRLRRIQAFIDPWSDPSDTGFQAIQSFYAFGRGGYLGLGLGDSNQKLFYLPEAHTDFIFSVIGEELGFVGAMAIVALFIVLVWRGFLTAYRAPDAFGAHLGIGLTLLLGVQAFVNMGVAVGILPTKGLTLPFISMGGSSMVISMLCVGVLLNISEQSSRH